MRLRHNQDQTKICFEENILLFQDKKMFFIDEHLYYIPYNSFLLRLFFEENVIESIK